MARLATRAANGRGGGAPRAPSHPAYHALAPAGGRGTKSTDADREWMDNGAPAVTVRPQGTPWCSQLCALFGRSTAPSEMGISLSGSVSAEEREALREKRLQRFG